MPLTAKDVAEIMRLLEESDFEELQVEQDGLKLTLRRGAAPRAVPAVTGTPDVPTAEGGAMRLAHAPQSDARLEAGDRLLIDVIAPFVGIFYRAPKPGAPPYVDLGVQVAEDTIVGIIEVMKLMNTVRAETRGTVAQILVADGGVVEYGQVLLRISPASNG